MFAGLRPGEADGLRWERIDFEALHIEVLAETSKTRETRYVPMEPLCVEWLAKYRKPSGLLRATPDFWPKWSQVRADAGFALLGEPGDAWITDILRHTLGSYWLAIFENRHQLAEILGNSVETIKAHYRKAIPKHIAKAFWSLTPAAVLNA
jgi:integrase